jgi:aerobic carbon-monoxide dehydrogenase large subunit
MPAISADFETRSGSRGSAKAGTRRRDPHRVNAILGALAPFGATDVPMPATAEPVWRAIR